jgi:hypothetical protein
MFYFLLFRVVLEARIAPIDFKSSRSALPGSDPPSVLFYNATPSLALAYIGTADHFPDLLLSAYSLFRVAKPSQRLFFVTVHIWWLPAPGHSVRSVSIPLAFLRSISPFPIVLHVGYCPISWFSPWNAAHRSDKRLTWAARLCLRLFLPRLLNEEYIFFVDNDTLWGRDFRLELRALLVTRPGRPIYICRDCSGYRPDGPDWFKRYLASNGHQQKCFANAGSFIWRNNLSDIDQRFRRAVQVFNRYYNSMWPDQDVLNHMYSCNEKELIPPVWNNHVGCLESILGRPFALDEAIIHHGHDLHFPEVKKEWEQRFKEWKGQNPEIKEEVDENGRPVQEPLEPWRLVDSSWWSRRFPLHHPPFP